jgi:uncharacterized paraquat-inducible protein A
MQFILFTLLAALVAVGVQRMSREAGKRSFTRKPPKKEALSAQEMVQCPVCKTYVIKDPSGNCPRCSDIPPSVA